MELPCRNLNEVLLANVVNPFARCACSSVEVKYEPIFDTDQSSGTCCRLC